MIYDYLVIGAGSAGLQLALAMLEDPFFSDRKIGILEKAQDDSPDKTWCYWEKGHGRWDALIDHQWEKGFYAGGGKKISLNLNPYRYKKLAAKKFYQVARARLKSSGRIEWIHDEITGIRSDTPVEVTGLKNSYLSHHVFDSRIDPDFYQNNSYKKIWQHFKGWEIKTEKSCFDPGVFTMMDYRVKYHDSTTFTYVLPVSTHEALVEFTFFTPFLIDESKYDPYLYKYIETILKIRDYEITRVEKGIIPMSDYPFHKNHQKNITKIGTAGGWVRPSSGYSFHNSEKYIGKLIENLKSKLPAHKGIARNRFRTYDTIFLDLLEKHNELGEDLFTSMYSKNSIQQIFRFLDEESSLLEEIRIISTFEKWPFLKAAMRQI